VVGAVALEQAGVFLEDAGAEEFAGHETDVDLRDQPVVLLDVVHRRSGHVVPASSTFVPTGFRSIPTGEPKFSPSRVLA